MTQVVALGQVHGGDDAVGVVIAARLRAQGIEARVLGDASELITLLGEGDARDMVIVDAVVGGGPPGTLHVLDGEDVSQRRGPTPVSTHGIGVGEAIAIARALGGHGGLPQVRVVGVAIDPPSGVPNEGLSPAVAAAVEGAAAIARRLADEARALR